MPERETTHEILSTYHEIGHREALKTWRANVPGDARRAWIKDFIKDAGRDKLADIFPAILKKHLASKDRQELEHLEATLAASEQALQDAKQSPLAPLAEWEDESDRYAGLDECIDDAHLELQTFLEQVFIPDTAYEEFAKAYFLSFDTNEERAKEFFAQQERQVEVVAKALDKTFPPGSIACLVVYGSGAIGPRTKGYPKEQDVDLLVIPHGAILTQPKMFTTFANTIQELDYALHEQEEKLPAAWQTVAKLFKTQHTSLDLFAPRIITDMTLPVSDWKKLCGPHRVAHTFGPDGEAAYRYVLEESVESMQD